MIKRYCFLTAALILIASSLVLAYPFPLVFTNVNPEGNSTLVRDENGQILSSDYRVHIIADVDGDGIDQPSNIAGEYGMPTDDDEMVIFFTVHPGNQEDVPTGAFYYETGGDSEFELHENAVQYYVRVFNEVTLTQNTRFAESQLFLNPEESTTIQTIVLPERMYGYLGNTPQLLELNPDNITILPGEEATTVVSSNDPDSLFFWAVYDGNPDLQDLVRFERLNFNEMAVSWILPTNAPDNNILEIFSSDGQITVSINFEVNISGTSDLPTAFHLVSPKNEKTAFENLPFVWNQSYDPNNDGISYNFIYATTEDFSDADSLTGLIDTTASLDFDAALNQSFISAGGQKAIIESKINSVGKKGKKNSQSGNSGTDNKSQALLNNDNRILLNPETVTVDVVEGQTIYWKVNAYSDLGFVRGSIDTWHSVAEIPDAPNDFDLTSPINGVSIEDLTPAFAWEMPTDSDAGDSLHFELIWSVNDFATADTVFDIAANSYDFSDPTLLAVGGSPFAESIISYLENSLAELDDFPENVTVQWFVDAIDIPGLRTSSPVEDFLIAITDAPMPFDLAYPADETIFHGPSEVILRWTPSADNDPDADLFYEVLWTDFDIVPEPANFENRATNIHDTHFIMDVADFDDMVIHWAVRAISGDDTTWANAGFNGYFGFTLSLPQRPALFGLMEPLDGALVETLTPTLSWNEAEDPDIDDELTYTLYWSIDNWENADSLTGLTEEIYTFAETVSGNITQPGNPSERSGIVTARQRGKSANRTVIQRENINPLIAYLDELDEFDDSLTVYWKVRAQDTNSIGRWCRPNTGWSFDINIDYPPTSFNLLTPDSGSTFMDSTITFAWEQSEDPDSLGDVIYHFIYADNAEFTDSVDIVTIDTNYQLDTGTVEPGTYWWYVLAVDNSGKANASNQTWSFVEQANYVRGDQNGLPKNFALHSVYPNPFNPTLNVVMAVPRESCLEIVVYDILGRETMRLPSHIYSAGYPRLILDFNNFASGNYFIQMRTQQGEIFRQKVTLVK